MNSEKVKYYQIALQAFKNGKNIVSTLRKLGVKKSECIELAYEIQAGSYTLEFNDRELSRNKALHSIINQFTVFDDVNSIGVFGVGEAKNWIGYEGRINNLFGVELSFSRLRWAHKNLEKVSDIDSFCLIKGDAAEKIFNQNSFDISLTLHSIEPNGNEQGASILHNVIESSSKYVILFEPDYSTAHKEMKNRMENNDYVRNISDELSKMKSINIIDKFVMDINQNPDNLTTCWIIEKINKVESVTDKMVCPFTNGDLNKYNDMMYSPKAGVGYPIINEFIFLNKNDAVFIGETE
jgi:hypothetical protein